MQKPVHLAVLLHRACRVARLLGFGSPPGGLNNLVKAVAIGRDTAGVHYRQDGNQGLEAGQQQTIAYLQGLSRTFNESLFGGFTLTKFDGQTITIKDGQVTSV